MHTPRRGTVGRAWRFSLFAVLFAAMAIVPVAVVQTPALAHDSGGGVGTAGTNAADVDRSEAIEDGGDGEFDESDFADEEFFVPQPVEQLVALPGDCPTAAPIQPGNSIDCFFEILPTIDSGVLQFADLLFDGLSWSCHVEPGAGGSDRLVCPGLLEGRFEEGPVDFSLRVEGQVAEAAARATLSWGRDPIFSLLGDGEGESVVFDGRPLRWISFAYEPVDGLFLNFRERNEAAIVSTVEIEASEVFESVDGSMVPDLPVGRYRMWPCVGATATTCEEQPGGRSFQIIDGEPLELVPGHNRRSAERINVLFVSSGLQRAFDGDQANQLPELARTMLTIGGPAALDFNGELIVDDEPADRLLWGPMAIEPLASNLDRFNFWYLPDEIADEVGMLFGGLDPAGDAGFDLPNLQITALYNDGSVSASDARRTSFESLEPADVPTRGRLRFGDARVWIPSFDPLSGVTTLAHEWGHGLFGLRDEYYGFDGRPIAVGFPNCAPDLETAERWWGDLTGEVDPFVADVLEIQEARLMQPEFANVGLADRTAIEVTAGGCYSDFESTEVYRPSADSLMNSEVPVFGAVNRERVEEVLDRFGGRGPMSSLSDLTISCEGLAGFVTCRGELLSHLDKPLSIVALNSNPCEFGSARLEPDGTMAPVPVTCATTGDPDSLVNLSFKSENVTLDVAEVDLESTPTLPRQVLTEREASLQDRALADAEAADGGPSTGRTVAIGGLLCIAAISLGFVERRRRRAGHHDDLGTQ